ncbi:uncharacterized protein LOC130440643 [Diorhabda sublineata]|uniref:uncharacterized protein LOC130440643 n=1 Tax=Diorhabda sublineata TaxID=1163346 RepID=UPI0024E0CDD7|nr:uncharacterized protein LOC130440643 [Diorhabda sublineata]
MKTWIDYLKRLYSQNQLTTEEPETPEITTDEETRISTKKVEEAERKLKTRKATGSDGIANEFLKNCGKAMTEQLALFINKILKYKKVPEEWKTSILIPFFKNGDRKEP